MANNELEFRTVSQCSTADWCRGYNEAVKTANEIISRLEAKNKDLQVEAYKEFLAKMVSRDLKRVAQLRRGRYEQ